MHIQSAEREQRPGEPIGCVFGIQEKKEKKRMPE